MDIYTPIQWLAIDVANQYGLDKLTFDKRLAWVKQNINDLEKLTDQADGKTKPLYIKAVQALRLAQQGKPTGHLVGLDAVCSGIQIMSALTGCTKGAEATGLLKHDVRPDAYTYFTEAMNEALNRKNIQSRQITRKEAKEAVMTAFYGSAAVPKQIFGKGIMLSAFEYTMSTTFVGAYKLLTLLLKAWNPYTYAHEWQLPDGFNAVVKVMVPQKSVIRIAELGDTSFTYLYYVNEPYKKGSSLPANVVHSVDAYIVRSMHRRCNYDASMVNQAKALLEGNISNLVPQKENVAKVLYYLDLYKKNDIADVVILPYLDTDTILLLPNELINKLLSIINIMLESVPFDLVTVHDEFKCHANYVNQMRKHYRNILADIADSNILQSLLNQLYEPQGMHIEFAKECSDLSKHIRNSNYAIC